MSSNEVILHIIRDITTRSSAIFKTRKSAGHGDVNVAIVQCTQSGGVTTNEGPCNEIPEDIHLLNTKSGSSAMGEGIHSQVTSTHVTETLAAFLIRAVVLDPKNDFHIENELSRGEVARLTDLCVERIVAIDDPVQATVRMQVYFDTNFPAQLDFLHKEKLTRINSCSNILQSILEAKSKSITAYEELYRKIVSFVFQRTHVGNATDLRVVREVTAALESVFPQSELNAFMALSRNEKEAQLVGLSQLVTGIRLFNKQLGKGGESIHQLPEVCMSELREMTTLLHTHTQLTETLIQRYKAVLDYKDATTNSEVSEESAERIRCALIFRRQHLIYLDAIQEQITKAQEVLVLIGEKFDETIRELKSTCKSKTAVPVDQVYPQFIRLFSLWSNWTDELFLLAFRRGVLDQISYFASSFNVEVSSLVETLSARFQTDIEPEILPESEVISKATTTMETIAMISKTVEVIHPGNTTQYYKLPVEYGGFCPTSLVDRNGLMVPGDKSLGMIRYKDRLFAFATIDLIADFCKSPDQYMERVINMAKAHAGFVQLLHLYNYFPTVEALERAKSYTRQRLLGQMPIVAEIGCQVDTHIVDTNINSKYHWNQWDLRREALMLVNLKGKQTHSTQTNLSHFRCESETQFYQPKSSATQTKKTSSTSVPRNVVFYAGLRNSGEPIMSNMYTPPFGNRAHHFRAVDLTVDYDGGPVPYSSGIFGLKSVMPPIAGKGPRVSGKDPTDTRVAPSVQPYQRKQSAAGLTASRSQLTPRHSGLVDTVSEGASRIDLAATWSDSMNSLDRAVSSMTKLNRNGTTMSGRSTTSKYV
ncbi:hypothetical protein BASA60_005691 [Batrachochytrium salamandrivorans]|nr:hypothetical protein BASA60_005691 [Batrachochytrium salamandrivorans]KAH9250138.1 hypothetical protein BASA81_012095 [Batrachochytrium salamandrivorans]